MSHNRKNIKKRRFFFSKNLYMAPPFGHQPHPRFFPFHDTGFFSQIREISGRISYTSVVTKNWQVAFHPLHESTIPISHKTLWKTKQQAKTTMPQGDLHILYLSVSYIYPQMIHFSKSMQVSSGPSFPKKNYQVILCDQTLSPNVGLVTIHLSKRSRKLTIPKVGHVA